jgi:hypothetical protein
VSRSDLAFILESGVSPANPSGAVVGQCMRSKGFSWIDPVPASTSGDASPGQDEAFVAKFGYGILSGPTDPAEPDPNLALFNALSDGCLQRRPGRERGRTSPDRPEQLPRS